MPDKPRFMIMRLKGAEDIVLPRYVTAGSAGMDIRAAVEESAILQPGERALIPTGFAIALPPGYEAQIRPRSGLAIKYGITLPNAPGTIDSDYRGEVCIIVMNAGQEEFTVNRNDRIAQMIISRYERIELEEVEKLPTTGRGTGGFGHTGTS